MVIDRAIFLDRDGTLIKSIRKTKNKTRPPYKKSELKIYNDVKYLNKLTKFFFLIIVSNQPDIKRGLQTHEFNNYINQKIKKKIKISKFYMCICVEKDEKCKCYKPKTKMLLEAKKKFKLNLKKSYVIGDTWRDIKMGKDSKCTTILIERGQPEILKKIKKYNPDFIISSFKTLLQKKIIKF